MEIYFLIGLFISCINTAVIMPALFGMLYQPSILGFVVNGVLWPLTLWRWINYFLPVNKKESE